MLPGPTGEVRGFSHSPITSFQMVRTAWAPAVQVQRGAGQGAHVGVPEPAVDPREGIALIG
jgi:hypothetical protein